MKRNSFLLVGIVCISLSAKSQYNTPWTTNTLNTTNSGFIGIGTKSTSGGTNTPLPNFNLHLHGTADFIYDDRGGMSINYGKTVRLGLTNTVTGSSMTDGAVLRMSENHFSIKNQENGNLTIGVPNVALTFNNSTDRVWLGGNANTSANYAKMNIVVTDDDGLLVQTALSGKTALKIKAYNNDASAMEVFGADWTQPNFKIFGSGTVYARKYVTTLANFPDYVFSETYHLMPLSDLRSYILENKHLPNIPSAEDVERNGADIGELNRVLVEKVEELTLYILQLEERINELEESNVIEEADNNE